MAQPGGNAGSPVPSLPSIAQPGNGGSGRELTGLAPLPPSPNTILSVEVQPIDLTTALRLAGVQNPEINVARRRILIAVAERQLAAAYFLPSINPGANYDTHTGVLQQSNGNMLSVNRSAVYVGAGSNAVAAGTVNVPGVFLQENVGLGIYNYLASRQVVREREFDTLSVRNQVLLQVTQAYSELLRAEGTRAVQDQAREEARVIVKLTTDFAKSGQGREADANRAATNLAMRESDVQKAEADVLVASATLCQLLNLDPSIRLHPTDAFIVPHPLVPDPISVKELIAIGMLNRPELAAQRAAIQAALMNLGGAKILPFSPNLMVGFSAGGFGGGSNLVRPLFGGFGGRTDTDVIGYWTIQNLGLGNVALIRQASARLQVSQFQQVEILNMVRAQVAEAYAKAHARYAQISTYESAVRAGFLSFHEDLDRIKLMGGNQRNNVLPIELLNSFDLLATSRKSYLDTIIDFNRAQFEMYVALGQPPADVLAQPAPTEGVYPRNLPARPASTPAGAAPNAARPSASSAPRASSITVSSASGVQGVKPASMPTVKPDRSRDVQGAGIIPPPTDVAGLLKPVAR